MTIGQNALAPAGEWCRFRQFGFGRWPGVPTLQMKNSVLRTCFAVAILALASHAWGAPPQVANVRFQAGTLTWSAQTGTAGYNV